MSTSVTLSKKHEEFVNSLIKIGHIDRQDSRTRSESTTSVEKMDEEVPDKFFETISELGIVNKELLFLGTIHRRKSQEVIDGNEANATPTLKINCREETKDIVALNYISNHLDTDDLRTVLVESLDALRPLGHLAMREHLQGSATGDDLKDKFYFRHPSATCTMLNSIVTSDGQHGLQLISALSPDPVGGKQEMTWLYQKVPSNSPSKKLQEFLDAQQYTKKGILKYEKIFGAGFVSTGGEKTTKEFSQLLHLKSGQTVLDVGCGIGGSGFYMAKEYGVFVHGMDLSSNMISIAIEKRRLSHAHNVDFEISNVLTREFPAESFDLVYSRDVILHIAEKKKLFQNIFKWLKPGGKVFITDYCCGVKEHSQDFKDYVSQRGYILLTVPDYGKLLEEVGFVNVRAEDRTKQFVSVLHTELQKFEPQKSDFIEDFSQADYDELVDGWNAKVKRCSAGDQVWGMFLAEKK